jgi:hypothetical protein
VSEKMATVEYRAVGSHPLDEHNEARIERNLFAFEGQTWEGLRFCKNRDGRHNRVHLVIGEDEFVQLFQNAVENGVFRQKTVDRLRVILSGERDPILDVIGIADHGGLAADIDSELYGENSR